MQAPDLESTTNRQSCEWLSEVALRLHIVIEVIDANQSLLCPIGSSTEAGTIRRLVTADDSSIRIAMNDAARSKMPVPILVDGIQVLCFGLAPGGILLLAKRLGDDDSMEECRHDLESIGAWLTGAIEANLGQPNAIGVEPYRIVSFRRILGEAAARGSLKKVVGAFVEALSVWDDVRVSGYVAGAHGGFFQYVSSVAALPSSLPDQLDEERLPPSGRLLRLSRADADRLGITSDPGDTLLLRLRIGTATEWALVFSGMIDDRVEVRLRVYSDILRESMDDVLMMAASRAVADVARRQLPANESLESAAQTALNQLSAAVGGRQGAVMLTSAIGRQTFSIGPQALLADPDQVCLTRLVVRVSDASGVMTLAVEREQNAFMAFEREILQAGAAAMYPWVQAAVQRANESERRHSFRPVDTVFDQLAREAVQAGQHASVIVMSLAADTVGPGLLSAWVAKIRGQLRGGDRAGLLSEKEIAVLLCGASADQAAIVSSRLKHLFDIDDTPHGYLHPTFGMMTRPPHMPFEGSLVHAARTSAVSLS